MKFFADTADVAEIRELDALGLLDGATTNPSLIMKSGRPIAEAVGEICSITSGPVSAEVAATEYGEIMREAQALRRIASNVCIKVPLTPDGLKACRALAGEGAAVNVTLCFSAVQALLAARSGAAFISPFVGRLDDIGEDGIGLLGEIRAIYDQYGYATQILAASIRSAEHVRQAALAGAHALTAPPAILKELFNHALTDKGLAAFLADWKKTGQKIG